MNINAFLKVLLATLIMTISFPHLAATPQETKKTVVFYEMPFPEYQFIAKKVTNFATDAIVSAYTVNFIDYEQSMKNSSSFFSPQGLKALKQSKTMAMIINEVKEKKLVITAIPMAKALIGDRKMVNKQPTWIVQVPLLVTIQSARDITQFSLLVTMNISLASDASSTKDLQVTEVSVVETGDGNSFQFVPPKGKEQLQPYSSSAVSDSGSTKALNQLSQLQEKLSKQTTMANNKTAPLTEPKFSDTEIIIWASAAFQKMYALDYVHFRSELHRSAKLFTPGGFKMFLNLLNKANTLKSVKLYKFVVGATPTITPSIMQKGIINGRFSWRVVGSMSVIYQSSSVYSNQNVKFEMLIQRVPSDVTSAGIAIESIIITPIEPNAPASKGAEANTETSGEGAK